MAAAIVLLAPRDGMAQEHAVQHELVTEYVRNPIEYRALVEQALEAHMGALGLILTQRAPHADLATFHADALVTLTSIHASLFPEDSKTPQTRESIWTDAEEFEAASTNTADLARQVRAAVESGNVHQELNRLVALGQSCASCHSRFRVEADQ